MKYLLCYVIGDLEFVKFIIREYLLWLIGKRSTSAAHDNIQWFKRGGAEFEYVIENCKDIPCEVALSYIGHINKCVYNKED